MAVLGNYNHMIYLNLTYRVELMYICMLNCSWTGSKKQTQIHHEKGNPSLFQHSPNRIGRRSFLFPWGTGITHLDIL